MAGDSPTSLACRTAMPGSFGMGLSVSHCPIGVLVCDFVRDRILAIVHLPLEGSGKSHHIAFGARFSILIILSRVSEFDFAPNVRVSSNNTYLTRTPNRPTQLYALMPGTQKSRCASWLCLSATPRSGEGGRTSIKRSRALRRRRRDFQ